MQQYWQQSLVYLYPVEMCGRAGEAPYVTRVHHGRAARSQIYERTGMSTRRFVLHFSLPTLHNLLLTQIDEMEFGGKCFEIDVVGRRSIFGIFLFVFLIFVVEVERVFGLRLPLLLDVESKYGVRTTRLIVHVGRRRRSVKSSVLQTSHRLLFRKDRSRRHADLQQKSG